MAKIFYATADCGDGSNTVVFFLEKDRDKAQDMIDEEEEYYGNEGRLRYFTVPDDLDVTTLGLRFTEPTSSEDEEEEDEY